MIARVPKEHEIEYRGFLGLDKRKDRSLVPRQYQTNTQNRVLVQGVLWTRKGNSRWGTLDLSTLSGTAYSWIDVVVGASTYILVHKGARIYVGLKSDTIPGAIQNLAGADLEVTAAASGFERLGTTVGADGNRVIKVLFKQDAGCKELEFDGATWVGKNAGIAADMSFTVDAGGAGTNQPLGTFRVRVVAQRVANGVRTSESAPTGKSTGTGIDDGYQQVEITSASQAIRVTLTHASPDAQITHYQVQVTRALNMVGDTNFSDNGNDPEVFFETASVASATALAGAITLDVKSLLLRCPNIWGFKPLPGTLHAVAAGGVVFFAMPYSGDTPYQARIYRTGSEGKFYHAALYNPFESYNAGEEDGEIIMGLGKLSDHLVVFKESRTGILPNRSGPKVVWRDESLGIENLKAFRAISEDLMLVLNQDGQVRLFDGISYSSTKDLDKLSVDFTENIREVSALIDPATVDFVYHEERLHLLYTDAGARKAYVFHRRDGWAWTNWIALSHDLNLVTNRGRTWIFFNASDGKIYEQSPTGEVYTDNGADILTEDTFAVLHADNRRNTLELWDCMVEGYFETQFRSRFTTNDGFVESVEVYGIPDPAEHPTAQWFASMPQEDDSGDPAPVFGNWIEHTVYGIGKSLLRGIRYQVVEMDPGSAGWSVDSYSPGDFVGEESRNLEIDAGEDDRVDADFREIDAGEDDRVDNNFADYVRG